MSKTLKAITENGLTSTLGISDGGISLAKELWPSSAIFYKEIKII